MWWMTTTLPNESVPSGRARYASISCPSWPVMLMVSAVSASLLMRVLRGLPVCLGMPLILPAAQPPAARPPADQLAGKGRERFPPPAPGEAIAGFVRSPGDAIAGFVRPPGEAIAGFVRPRGAGAHLEPGGLVGVSAVNRVSIGGRS